MKPMNRDPRNIIYDPEEDLSAPGIAIFFLFNLIEMMVSDAELALNQIPLDKRDFCSHLLIDVLRCQRRKNTADCHHIEHKYEACKVYEYYYKVLFIFSIIRRRKIALRDELESKKS